jgi:type IV pilus assembly protein PilB
VSAAELPILRLNAPARVFDPVGCAQCGQIGYRGRHAIHETLHVNSEIKHIIEKMDGAEKIRETAAGAGMTTLYDNCRQLVLEGATSIQEMVNTVYAGA